MSVVVHNGFNKMSAIIYDCGCAIYRSMFGDRPLMGIMTCVKHIHLLDETKVLADVVQAIEKTANEINHRC